MKVCQDCGQEVTAVNTKTGTLYNRCDNCRVKHNLNSKIYKSKNKNHSIYNKNCRLCWKEFKTVFSYKVYCSRICKNKSWNSIANNYAYRSKEQRSLFAKKYYIRKKKKNNLDIKLKFLEKYGNKCFLCGESNKEVLTLDHIGGGGGQDRKQRSSYVIYNEAIYLPDSSKFRILCMNCNWKTRYSKEIFTNEYILAQMSIGE